MDSRQWQVRAAALPVALLVLGFYGCAERPSIAQLAAPPPSAAAGAGIASGEAGGGNSASPGANEGAGHGRAGLTTPSSATRAARPAVRAVATTGGPTSGARSRAGQKAAAGASGPGGASAVGGGLPSEEAAGGTSNGSAANGSTTGGPVAAAPGGPAKTAAESPMGTSVQGQGGGAAAGNEGTALHAAARPAPSSYSEAPELQDIHFDFDRYAIRPDDTKTLDTDAGWLRSNPRALLLIEGHCDERGTNEYNLALGQHRAKSTMDYLVAQGIAASRITTISYGEERPLCTEHTEECWAKNRRAHFLVKAE